MTRHTRQGCRAMSAVPFFRPAARLCIYCICCVLCVVLVGCAGMTGNGGGNAAGPTPSPTQPAAVPTSTPRPADGGAVVGTTTPTPWVPPTALVGTPIPGAQATLTAAPRLRTAPLTIINSSGEQVHMTVEIADTPEARELGLMHRSSMPPDAGMLFDFGQDTTSGFWMYNTILPLSIAFITADGTILAIRDMQPLDTTVIEAPAPYRYALEANQGFFAAHNITPGDRAILP